MKSHQMSEVTNNLVREVSVIKVRLTTEGLLQILEPLIRRFLSQRDEEEQGKVMRQQFDWVISIYPLLSHLEFT
jgi:hypothetical protein